MQELQEKLFDVIKGIVYSVMNQHQRLIENIPTKETQSGSARYLRRKEAAGYMNCSPTTIDRYARAGKLRRIYPFNNNTVRFDREEIDLLMANQFISEKPRIKGTRHEVLR